MTSLRLHNVFKLSNVVPISYFSRSTRAFVTPSKPLRKEDVDEKVEQTCKEVTEAADEVKQGFDQVSKTKKDVKGKVYEAKQSLVKRARENVVDVAAQKAKERVIKKIK